MTIVCLLDLEREAEIRAYHVLGVPSLPALERIADLAALICRTAVAEVNVITATEQVHLAASDGNTVQASKEDSFCGRMIDLDLESVLVPDAAADPRFADSPYATGEAATVRTYAAARLVAPSGTVLGTLCVFDETPVELDDGQLDALVSLAATAVSVLEMHRKEVELAGTVDRLADSHRELHASNESLEAFAGQISHDLQAPLTAVEVALELLEDEVRLEGDAQTLVDHARSGVRRMQRSITDLLDFAVAGSVSPTVPVDLDEVVRTVLTDLGPALAEAQVEVGPLPRVLGHETELRSVVQNLITNAVKFSVPLGEVVVDISARIDAGLARIVVADHGPGVPEAERDEIFRLNVRGHTDVDGHGIGLATCARVVRSLGGSIGVEPAPSGGAAFWFELPLAR